MKKRMIYIAIIVLVIVAILFVLVKGKSAKTSFLVEAVKIEKGTISNTITATGKLEAIKTVEVGTQVSGVIDKIFVDFNSQVKKGQLLAKIDETPLLAQLEQSKSSVDNSEAEVTYQKATYDRYKILADKKLIAQSDYDLVVYNYSKALANLANAKSVYDKTKINLAYASIYSPIDGIILDRAVDEGQTVAASFNTPTLFTIANDLTQMQVEANVDEADIGQVQINQRVEFTVDAYPNITFNGSVTEVRLQPVTTSNVVTYTVIINAPNPDKKLMPGMTASITVIVKEKKDIPVVLGKAIRFSPDQKLVFEYMKSLPETDRPKPGGGIPPQGMGPTQGMGLPADGTTIKPEGTFVWVKKGQAIFPRKIETGDNDGINYEIISGLDLGDEVVVSLEKQTAVQVKKAARSPFMPQRPGGPRK
jgi:HlyD family secretion protein